jgi:predicted metal-dependent hydrolase
MPDTKRSVDIQGEAVRYRVVRSGRASKVRIDAGLEGIKLVLPKGMDVDPDTLLTEKGDWVLKQRDRFARYREQMPNRQFEEGETFPVLGTERSLEVQPVLWSHVTDRAIRLAQDRVEKTSIRDELERVYREEARRHFTGRADHFAERMGISYSQIQIRNQKTRWGSYSPRTGTLSLNFRLLMAPPDVIDYVLVHELAHAEHPNHGRRFWRLVAQYVPDYDAKNEWLKENSAQLIFTRRKDR